MRKELGRIQNVSFGKGGYQGAMIGITFTLGGEGWGIGDFWGEWGIERSEYAKWTEASRVTGLGEMVMKINELLEQAGVEKISDLKNIPIEITFNGQQLDSWRILTEVIK